MVQSHYSGRQKLTKPTTNMRTEEENPKTSATTQQTELGTATKSNVQGYPQASSLDHLPKHAAAAVQPAGALARLYRQSLTTAAATAGSPRVCTHAALCHSTHRLPQQHAAYSPQRPRSSYESQS